MNVTSDEPQCFLKKALVGNAAFSGISGLTVLFGNHWLVKLLGLPGEVSLSVLGVGLIVYAILLVLNARRPEVKISDAWVAVVLDAVWVAGSYVLIFVIPLSVAGKWVVALVAELVLLFAVLQWLGIRKIRKNEQPAQV